MSRVSRFLMLLQPEALLFQHKRLSFLIRPALKLSGLQKASVITNVMVSGTVQTEVVRKFNEKVLLVKQFYYSK